MSLRAWLLPLLVAGMFAAALQLQRCHRDAVTAATVDAQARADLHRQAAGAWEAQALQALLDLHTCQQQWADAQTTARDLIDAQATADAERARELLYWQRRWDSRSASCGDALTMMRDACADEVGPW